MTNVVDGQAITRCFELVEKVGEELRAFSDEASSMMREAVDECPTGLGFASAGSFRESWSRDYELACQSAAWALPLRKKGAGNHKPARYLGWQTSFYGDAVAVPDLPFEPEPLVHVYCWDKAINLVDMHWAFPADSDDEFIVDRDRLVIWGDPDSDWNQRQWLYTLRLLALKSRQDIETLLIKPAISLLQGGRAEEHFDLPAFENALVRYPTREKLIGED